MAADLSVRFLVRVLQAAVDPLDCVAFVLGDDAFFDVGVHLLVHEVLQLGEVIIWGDKEVRGWLMVPDSKEEDQGSGSCEGG